MFPFCRKISTLKHDIQSECSISIQYFLNRPTLEPILSNSHDESIINKYQRCAHLDIDMMCMPVGIHTCFVCVHELLL